MHYFITGTDTDAGKTYVTCLLLEALKREGRTTAGFKPFVCGTRDDAIHLANASSEGLSVDEVNPVWFKVPAAPYAAALMENRSFELNEVIASFQELTELHDHVLIEGAGGWEVPPNGFATMADFAPALAAASRMDSSSWSFRPGMTGAKPTPTGQPASARLCRASSRLSAGESRGPAARAPVRSA